MQVRFLLGPAGSGKTFRCLREIREALLASPDGPSLIFLAPKQATFQLERQLLADPALSGYTRLHILSFERLAEFVFGKFKQPAPELLGEEGRVMVLRALLARKRDELRLFRASARLPGFADQLGRLLRELQQHHLTPAKLETLAANAGPANKLGAKLHDLSLMLRAYLDWLKGHHLEDADRLLDLAAALLKSPIANRQSPMLGGLWLDGFAQMTPQELDLLAALAPHCERATLAFCLEDKPPRTDSWLSIWSPIRQTFQRCRDRLRAVDDSEAAVEILHRDERKSRFIGNPVQQHLERHWAEPKPFERRSAILADQAGSLEVGTTLPRNLRVAACSNPEAEAIFAAREILRYVREERARFRDCAILLRSFQNYADVLRRILNRYQIPFFLDRRESIAHHPLAELTRYALRTIAFGWEHDDWFGALKTGLVGADDAEIDRLENEALARGWRGAAWSERMGIGADAELSGRLERVRQKIMPPFQRLARRVAGEVTELFGPTGAELAQSLREFWSALKVEKTLERWTSESLRNPALTHRPSPIHETVWAQMNGWLENLELAFQSEPWPLRDWLPVVEAGLSQLTVGAVPPALDQVLVGTIDRSRNPDLRFAAVLGMNEGVFPAPAALPGLLTQSDRNTLASFGATLGPDRHEQIGFERFYAYIACTRAREKLILTYSKRDADHRPLNPSSFLDHLNRLFPDLKAEEFAGSLACHEAEHPNEIVVPLLKLQLRSPESAAWVASLRKSIPSFNRASTKWTAVAESLAHTKLSLELADRMYGKELRSSVSALEDFAACPFKYFAARGLRAEERVEFEVDPREKGSFQHEVLREFHRRLQTDGRRWREVTPGEARILIRQIGAQLLPAFRDGLFLANPSRQFTGQILIEGLERLMETLLGWAQQYQFDPRAVEVSFGLKESPGPAWRIDLDGEHALLLRGRIDRVDVCPIPETGEALAVVIDYKSSARAIEPIRLHHGLELQLLAYLGALAELARTVDERLESTLRPAGVFYVALKGGGGSAGTRLQERAERERIRQTAYQHRGRFDAGFLSRFDNRGQAKGDQFKFSKRTDGSFSQRGNDALPTEEFQQLVARIKSFLRQHGQDIYAGRVAVAPYRWEEETACDFCAYRPVCRFDPWTQPFRILRPPVKDDKSQSLKTA